MTLTLADQGALSCRCETTLPAWTPSYCRVSGDPWGGSVPLSRGKLNAGL